MVDQTSVHTFSRPPRIQQARLHGEIDIPAPPSESEGEKPNIWLSLLPASSLLLLAVFYIFMGGAGVGGPLFAVPMLAIGLVSVATALLTLSYQNIDQRRQKIQALRDYHRILDKRMARLQAARDLQLHFNRLNFPPPDALPTYITARAAALWNRRPGDEDFTAARLGIGNAASDVRVLPPDPDTNAPDIGRAMSLVFAYAELPGVGVALNLAKTGAVGIVGVREEGLSFLYALVAHLATFHAPAELNLYIFSSRLRYRSWNWARWLPHTSGAQQGGFPDFIAYEADHSRRLLDTLARRIDARKEDYSADHCPIIVIFDDVSSIRDEVAYKTLIGGDAVITLFLASSAADVPSDCHGIIHVEAGQFRVELTGAEGLTLNGAADKLSRAEVELIARQLAILKLPQPGDVGRIPTSLHFLQMYGAERIDQLAIQERWAKPVPSKGNLPFPVPIGNDSFSSQLMFDLSERAHGPHGVVGGTTGSGKSELLQTLVASLALEHHPYLVNFLLIDYKGGATFNIFRDLPHTVGIITNLNVIEALRALEAIKAENRRRQQFLADRNAEDITEYHRRLGRVGGHIPPDWDPLPHLVIIIDEFAELTTDLPNFLDELVATVRVGRSLGMHLILATQRPAGHVTPEMNANLNFRLSLRVQDPEESRELIRRPDAAFLPPSIPGRAFFLVGNELRLFQVARVGIEYAEETRLEEAPGAPPVLRLVRYEQSTDLLKGAQDQKIGTAELAPRAIPILAEVLAGQMSTLYRALSFRSMAPVLLESLPGEVPLEQVLKTAPYGGWDGKTWQPAGSARRWACVPIGLIDNLASRAQPPLSIDFPGQGGHFLVAGGPGTGKTTLLRCLVMSLAHLFRPDEAEIYILSFAGRGLDIVERLPHVGAVIRNEEHERLLRLIRRLLTLLDERRYAFAQVNADDLETYNSRVHIRETGLKPLPAIFILIDNFVELRQAFEDEMEDVLRLIRDGRAVGVHFAITAPTTTLPYTFMNLIEHRFALRLAEKSDYLLFFSQLGEREVDPRPGSGLLSGKPPLHCQIALPASGEDDDARDQHLQATIAAMRAAWGDRPAAEPVLVLPETVPLSGLLALLPTRAPDSILKPPEPLQSVIGLDGMTLRPNVLNWLAEGTHFLINGPVATGKSSLIRTLILGVAQRYAPHEVSVLLIDFSQESLRPLRRLPHVIDYVTDETGLFSQLRHFQAEITWRRAEIERRKQGGGDDSENLMDTAHYPFPPIIVAIDDYDQLQDALGGVGYELFDELGKMIRRDSRLGFHFLIAGETSNMSRAGDMILKQLRLTRSGFCLVSADSVEVLGGRVTTAMRRDTLPDGRGYHVTRNAIRLVQFAHTLEPASLVRDIVNRWGDAGRAVWAHPYNGPDNPPAPTASGPANRDLPGLDFDFDLSGALEDYRKQQGYTG
jgi:S-DNA-T family DNA segregation ATPase FtsK/SpoIIIE